MDNELVIQKVQTLDLVLFADISAVLAAVLVMTDYESVVLHSKVAEKARQRYVFNGELTAFVIILVNV